MIWQKKMNTKCLEITLYQRIVNIYPKVNKCVKKKQGPQNCILWDTVRPWRDNQQKAEEHGEETCRRLHNCGFLLQHLTCILLLILLGAAAMWQSSKDVFVPCLTEFASFFCTFPGSFSWRESCADQSFGGFVSQDFFW